MRTVTAIIGEQMYYAYDEDQLTSLLDVVFEEPHSGWAGRLAAWSDDMARSGSAPDHRLRVSVDLATGWAALNFLQEAPETAHWEGWNTYNDAFPAQAPELAFGRSSFTFPQSASMPVQQARAAVEEYCHQGEQPTSVKWREASYF